MSDLTTMSVEDLRSMQLQYLNYTPTDRAAITDELARRCRVPSAEAVAAAKRIGASGFCKCDYCVVANELLRLADLMEGYGHLSAKAEVHQTHLLDARALRSRADELGPPR